MIDTHAHLFMCDQPIPALIDAAKLAGVTGIINVALDIPTALTALDIYLEFPMAYPTIGLYPSCAEKEYDLKELRRLASHHPFKAIGEIGLDQHHSYATPEAQTTLFVEQLRLAGDLHLPVIVHNRLADEEMLKIFADFRSIRKVFHCFSSSIEFADAQLALSEDTYFSFTGLITSPNGASMHSVIERLPMNRIMLETDCPYLTPLRYRGKKNQPAFVGEVAHEIARIKLMPVEDVIAITTANSIRFFNL